VYPPAAGLLAALRSRAFRSRCCATTPRCCPVKAADPDPPGRPCRSYLGPWPVPGARQYWLIVPPRTRGRRIHGGHPRGGETHVGSRPPPLPTTARARRTSSRGPNTQSCAGGSRTTG